jgi:hypothetical protein
MVCLDCLIFSIWFQYTIQQRKDGFATPSGEGQMVLPHHGLTKDGFSTPSDKGRMVLLHHLTKDGFATPSDKGQMVLLNHLTKDGFSTPSNEKMNSVQVEEP